MNKQEIINAIGSYLYDVQDLSKARAEAYNNGYEEAEDEADFKIQESRNSLHVYMQQACSQCGYAPHTLKREVVSGAVMTEMFSCSRCRTVAYPTVLTITIMLDGEEVR